MANRSSALSTWRSRYRGSIQAIAALRADGIEPDPIIDLGDVIPGFRIVFFRDREGNILELMEGYRDEE